MNHDPAPPTPTVARGVELLGPMPGSGYREPPLLVRRADGQTIQLTPLLYRVLEAIDGRRNHLEIAWEVATRTHKVLSRAEVAFLVEEKLRPLGLVTTATGEEPAVKRANPLLALRFRLVISDPRLTNRLTAPFAALFHPVLAVPTLVAFAWITAWVLFEKGLGAALNQTLYEPHLLLLVVALTVLSAAFHEFGHAAACRYGGATPGSMGAALYLVWPAFYTDVTDSYRLDRAGRLRVDVGGLYFNAVFVVATFGAWATTGADALLVMVPIQLFQMARQLLPVVRFDGYHILADLTGVPDLFARIKPTLLGILPSHWHDPETRLLKPWPRAVVTAWVLVVVPTLGVMLVLTALALPRLVATAGDSLRLQYAALRQTLGDGDVVDAIARVVSGLVIVLPPLAMGYLLARITHRTSRRAWRAADGHPLVQGALTAVGAGALASLAMVLWPGDHYAPVQADERAAVGDGLGIRPSPVLDAVVGQGGDPAPERAAPAPPARRLAPARPAARAVDVPAPRPPVTLAPDGDVARARPVGAPAAATRAAWPFPFAPPPAPRSGDNFAVAVNTVDLQHVADMSTSLLWVEDARVDQRNRSYALASCSACTTVAAAFQVIVADGTTRVAVPENAAVSVNYECTTCVTHSIAVQLVVTTRETPPPAVRDQVEARFAEAEALERRVHEVPAGELRARLLALKADIFRILEPYVLEEVAPTTSTTLTTTTTEPDGSTTTTTTEPDGSTTTTTTEPDGSTTTTTTEPDGSTTTTTEPEPTTSTTAPSDDTSEATTTTEPPAT